MATQTPQTAATPNTPDPKTLETEMYELGKARGKGKVTQIQSFLRLTEMAFHGKLSLDKNTHGDKDDAEHYAGIFYKGVFEAATISDGKPDNERKNASCFRTCIKLGGWSKGGVGEPLSVMNKFVAKQQKMLKDPKFKGKVLDVSNAFLRFARQQSKADSVFDDATLEAICLKTPAKLPDDATYIERIRKELVAIRDGKAAQNTLQDESEEVKEAISLLTKRLGDIAKERASKTPKLKQTAAKAATPAATATTTQP